jgi:glycosidase
VASRKPRVLIYQIFVDRFAGRGGTPLSLPAEIAEPWKHHAGGTLDGIAAKLDHVAALGADAIYLTPVFAAPSNHKYDTASFEEIDSAFGGGEAFDALAAECERRGLGLVLDGVFNHVGETHPWFVEARANPKSPKARWFRFRSHPDDYERWRGHRHLPELALDHPGPAAVVLKTVRGWIERGATGWRLDCANDLGLEVCEAIAAAAGGSADGAIGEVMTWASEWIEEGRLDGVMNYWFRESLVGTLRGEVDPAQLAANLHLMAERWRPEALRRSWNVLSSHDTPRLATLVPDAAARALARVLAFTVPGTPLCYYGEEIGMEGGPDPDNRRPMVWDESHWDAASLAHWKRLATLRTKRRALREGGYLPIPSPAAPSIASFARTTAKPEELAIVVANASASPVETRLFVPHSFLYDALPLADLTGSTPGAKVSAGSFEIALPPWGASILVPHDGTIPGYRFFK